MQYKQMGKLLVVKFSWKNNKNKICGWTKLGYILEIYWFFYVWPKNLTRIIRDNAYSIVLCFSSLQERNLSVIVHLKWHKKKVLKEFLKALCWLLQRKPSVTNSGWCCTFEVNSLILSLSLMKKFSQIYCYIYCYIYVTFTVKLWLYFFIWPGKKNKKKKQWYNLGCCKTMQFEIGDLAMKNNFVHCLQRLVHYFKGKSIYF